jgi:hypothetical protein
MSEGIALISERRIAHIEETLEKIENILDRMIEKKPPRTEYTVGELARIKGYSKPTILRIIRQEKIPFDYHGRDIVVKKEDAGRIKEKVILNNH